MLCLQSIGELKLVVAGGSSPAGSEMYSFATDMWTTVPVLPNLFWSGASTPYKDTFIMVMGISSKPVFEYDKENNSFFVWAKKFSAVNNYNFALQLPS